MNLIEELRSQREPVIESCMSFTFTAKDKQNKDVTMTNGPCSKVDGNLCIAYVSPEAKWRNGNCPLASHVITAEEQKKKINPLKQSKKSSKGS